MTDALREAAQQALEALEGVITDLRAAKAESERDWSLLAATQESLREHMAEVQRLRAALAQPATIAEWWAAKQAASGEPVAWTYTGIKADGSEHGPHLVWNPAYMDAMSASKGAQATPLYAAPQPAPARVPLTDEQINQITAAQWGAGLGAPYAAYRAYARAIEAAHGITPAKEAP